MIIKRVFLQPAFVLHTKKYRDSSLLVELFTKHFGRVTGVANGVLNNNSPFRGMLAPFSPLLVSYYGREDLQTLHHVELQGVSYILKSKAMGAGFYLNDLLLKLLLFHDGCAELYCRYQKVLTVLAEPNSAKIGVALRLFEKKLLEQLGYGLDLKYTADQKEILADHWYEYNFGCGFKQMKGESANSFSGHSLLALAKEELLMKSELDSASKLLRTVLAEVAKQKGLGVRTFSQWQS